MKRVFIIAEAGVNHNGSLDVAKQLVDVAVEAEADAVKFQTFKAENIVTAFAPKASYQIKTTASKETQLEMLKNIELSYESHLELLAYCKKKQIQFLSTAFDIESLLFLDKELSLPLFKISSGDITNGPLLLEFARARKPLILSTGMSTLGEVEQALSVIAFGLTDGNTPSWAAFKKAYLSEAGQSALREKVSLLHCTSLYPTSVEQVNLKAIETMRQSFNLPVGYSDHTDGISIAIAAVARGAEIVEKHFTLDKNLAGPDHKASLEPFELKLMVDSIREVEAALGDGVKKPTISELDTLNVARKSLVASSDLIQGQLIGEKNINILRPGTGKSPMQYWDILGKKIKNDVGQGEFIEQ
jgi:N-acetylneuraminate synthase